MKQAILMVIALMVGIPSFALQTNVLNAPPAPGDMITHDDEFVWVIEPDGSERKLLRVSSVFTLTHAIVDRKQVYIAFIGAAGHWMARYDFAVGGETDQMLRVEMIHNMAISGDHLYWVEGFGSHVLYRAPVDDLDAVELIGPITGTGEFAVATQVFQRCEDYRDNDGDGLVDADDPHCNGNGNGYNPLHPAERCGLLGIEPVPVLLWALYRRRKKVLA